MYKKGDRVTCEDNQYVEKYVTNGQTYTVIDTFIAEINGNQYLVLKDVEYSLDAKRFKKFKAEYF